MIAIEGTVYLKDHSLFTEDKNVLYTSVLLEIDLALKDLYSKMGLNYKKFHKMDPLSKCCILTSEILVNRVEIPMDKSKIGIFLANRNSSLGVDMQYQKKSFVGDEVKSNPSLFLYTLPNVMLGELSIRHGFVGEQAMWISEDFDATHFTAYVGSLFDDNALESAIIGWVDYSDKNENVFLSWVTKKNNTTEENVKFNAENINEIYEVVKS